MPIDIKMEHLLDFVDSNLSENGVRIRKDFMVFLKKDIEAVRTSTKSSEHSMFKKHKIL